MSSPSVWELYHRTSQTTQHLRGHAPLGGQKLRETLPCSCTPGGRDSTPTSCLNGFVGCTSCWGWNIKSDSLFSPANNSFYKLLPFLWQNMENIFPSILYVIYRCNDLAFVNEIHIKTWFSEIKWSQLSYMLFLKQKVWEMAAWAHRGLIYTCTRNITTTINERIVSNIQQTKSHVTASQQKIKTQIILNTQERIPNRKNKISNIQVYSCKMKLEKPERNRSG